MTRHETGPKNVVSIILAAGKGSRMIGYDGSKALLPLIPGASRYEGEQPMLLAVLDNLPPGPKAIVIHHRIRGVCQVSIDRAQLEPECPGNAIDDAHTFVHGLMVRHD